LAYIRVYTKDWNNKEADSFYLDYSYGGNEWYCFNGNNPILSADLEKQRVKNPKFIEKPDGKVILTAELVSEQGKRVFFDTDDFIEYYNERLADEVDLSQLSDIIQITDKQLDKMKAKWGSPEPVEKNEKPKYINPLIMHMADPFIYKHTDGFYYFTASYTDMEHNLDGKYQYDRIIIRKASTINGLADGSGDYTQTTVYKREPISNKTASPHVWAPEIHYIDGVWYIYYTTTISDTDRWQIRPHVLMCEGADAMKDKWTDKGRIVSEIEDDIAFKDFSLDHTSFEHKGKRYLLWAQKGKEGNSDIFIAQMSNPWTICTKAVAITKPEYNWEKHGFKVNEGPSILKRNHKIFMVFSAAGTDALYCMGMLTADENADLLEPKSWKKTPYPVFQSCRKNGQFGPGHNSFTVSEDGKEDLLVYHARQEERYLCEPDYQPLYDAGRNTSVRKIYWNKDGTPNFSVPVKNSRG